MRIFECDFFVVHRPKLPSNLDNLTQILSVSLVIFL